MQRATSGWRPRRRLRAKTHATASRAATGTPDNSSATRSVDIAIAANAANNAHDATPIALRRRATARPRASTSNASAITASNGRCNTPPSSASTAYATSNSGTHGGERCGARACGVAVETDIESRRDGAARECISLEWASIAPASSRRQGCDMGPEIPGRSMQGTTEAYDCDVLVIGGGPGGSTIATLLAQRGRRVVVLERDRHPRFHIGESLLPANMPIFEKIGALEKLRAIGRLKLGADFPREDGSYYTFRFDRALGDTPHYSFHVLREELDQMLFEHAREHGVDAREGAKVERVAFDEEGVTAQVNDNGTARTLRARYLVDASGRDTFLGKQLKLVKRSEQHQSAALFAHYRGVAFNEGDDAGNIISVYRFEHGW